MAILTCAAVSISAGSGCSRSEKRTPPRDSELVIELRWIENYPGEVRRDVDTGLYWALSFLGATLPKDASILSWHNDVVSVDLDAAQVPEASRAVWKKILRLLKSSDEYRKMGAIDIGRFVVLTLCSSHQYYALTGVADTYDQFLAQHRFDPKKIAIVESAVAHGNRLIEAEPGNDIRTISFIAYEGRGSLKDGTFSKSEIETLEFMLNGQLRFGLYDLAGKRKEATTPQLTTAGKPSKCLWCHEINLQPPFNNVTDVSGYYTTREFSQLIKRSASVVAQYRRSLESRTNFSRTNDHTYAELLYVSFFEPSIRRLAREWNLSEDTIASLLKEKASHANSEYRVLGPKLYRRADVDQFSPYATIAVPSDVREASSYEPDLLLN